MNHKLNIFSPTISLINDQINQFNIYLAPSFSFPLLPLDFADPCSYSDLESTQWNETYFPNSNKCGVYFIFGRSHDTENRIGVYIGKASLSKKIGNEAYKYLHPNRNKGDYQKTDKHGSVFFLECVMSIDAETLRLDFLAPALEEYLITRLKSSLHLLNKVGNK